MTTMIIGGHTRTLLMSSLDSKVIVLTSASCTKFMSLTSAITEKLNVNPLTSRRLSDSVAHFRNEKRAEGCNEISATTYQIVGATFDIFCGTSCPNSANLEVTYTSDFAGCMAACIGWNENMTAKCVAVSWYFGQYGPLGTRGGSECFLHWDAITQDAYADSHGDSARLHNETAGLPFVQATMTPLTSILVGHVHISK
jgi:hypothetical protein